jgi:ATP-binding cassette subfamily B protein
MTVGLVTNLFGALASTLSLLSSKFDDIGQLQEALQKISTPLSVVDADNAPDLDVRAGTIEFRDVTFGYQEGQKLFDGLNLSVAAGEKVGLVGVSGAGKTTLCQLLLRAYDVQGGGIYIDGQNIAGVTQDSLHAAIAVIPQEPVLFHRSLGDNIRYGRFDATRDEMLAGARAAQASEFIEKLPLQYDTLVGERGIKLSGGQRQRVAIARAIVKDSPILVLDEATSALDSETEKAIQAAMVEAMRGRTTIVVAHRLSTLSRMDRIVVMEEGRVIEEGTFLELKSSGGIFSRLWNLQAGGFLASSLSADTGESA